MPLDFPSSPIDGQAYESWIYSSSKGAWLAKPLEPMAAVPSPTAPLNPTNGDMWFNTVDGTTYVYYNDGNTAQWVEMVAPISANGYYSPNYIINGAFDINQRNFSSSTLSTYGFDRWLGEGFGGTTTYSSQAFTPGAAPVSGYEAKNFARLVTSGQSLSNHYAFLVQKIEDARTLAGQTATISFWARAASGTPKIAVEIYQAFGSGGSPSSVVTVYAGQVTLSTSWQRHSLTIQVPSVAGKTFGTNNDSLLGLDLFVSAGSSFDSRTGSLGIQNNTFDIWGVQVEAGSVATPFRRNANSLQGELAACQRYYVRRLAGHVYGTFASGRVGGTTTAYAFYQFPVEMRVAPSAIEWTGSGSNYLMVDTTGKTVTNLAVDNAGTSGCLILVTGTSFTTNSGMTLQANNNSSSYIGFSAEL